MKVFYIKFLVVLVYVVFNYSRRIAFADANSVFLGCVTKEIAKHFSKYFGMFITEAKYGDLPDFEIIENKYQ